MNADELMAGIKGYVDGQVAQLRGEMGAAFEQHVAAIHELQTGHNEMVMYLQTMEQKANPMLGLPEQPTDDEAAYRDHLLAEAVRLGIKASDLAKAKKAATTDIDSDIDSTNG